MFQVLIAIIEGAWQEPQVEFLRGRHASDGAGAANLQRNINVRILFRKARDDTRQEAETKRGYRGNAQMAGVEIADRIGNVAKVFQPHECTLHLFVKCHAFGCWLDAAADTTEELEFRDLFQPLDLTADGGLGKIEQFRAGGDAAGAHHRLKNFDLPEVHRRAPACREDNPGPADKARSASTARKNLRVSMEAKPDVA